MAGKTLFKYYYGQTGIFIAVLVMITLLIPYDQYGSECLTVIVLTFSYVWITFVKMRSDEDYTFINSLPITKTGQWDAFAVSTIIFIVSSYIVIYLLTLILHGSQNRTFEDILISMVTKMLFCVLMTSLCMLYLAHGIPGVKRILFTLLILGLIYESADRITRLTLVSLGYKGNNPINFIKEKWGFLTIPLNVLQSDKVTNSYYFPDFSVSARRVDFAIYCAVVIFLTAAIYYRAKKVYGRTDLEKPVISVVEKMHPAFIFIVSCIVSVIIVMFIIMGTENNYYVESSTDRIENISYYMIRNERIDGTITEGYYEHFSFQIYDMERNNKAFILWCTGVAAGILAGASVSAAVILKGKGKRA